MYSKNPPTVYRVVFIGDSSVGKTSIINRLVNDQFKNDEQATVGAMFVIYSECVNSERIEMQIWDTAGQEKFRSLGPIYYRSSQVGVIVIDVTSKSSFEHLEEWVDNFQRIAGQEALLVVAANKSDMGEEREVSDESMNAWSEANQIKWFLTSAREGTGIDTMFHYIANYLYENRTVGVPVATATVPLQKTQKADDDKTEKSCAC